MKKTISENNIGTETTIEMSLTLLGGMDKSESMDTLESEEEDIDAGRCEKTHRDSPRAQHRH